jgi:hypothetical protein
MGVVAHAIRLNLRLFTCLGVLVIGEGAKILGPSENVQDILIIAEYLRVKQFRYANPTTP